MKPIEQVQKENEAAWMALPGVLGVGVGECRGKPCLKVFVEGGRPKGLPAQVEGYTVEAVEAEPPEALESP